MKRIILTVTILILSSVFAWAEISGVPQLVNYQGKLTDANGDPLPTADYKLEFNIYEGATGGSSGDHRRSGRFLSFVDTSM